MTDSELMADLTEAATAEIVRRHRAAIVAVATRRFRDEHYAEDVAQLTLVYAFAHASEFDAERESLRSWLLWIAREQALETAA